jgi:outer membrane protein assembly factor BamD (BamD/ComL family)
MHLVRKKIIKVMSILLGVVICSCSTPPKIATLPSEFDSAATLFANAENLFNFNSHEKALEAYKEYLVRFRNGPNADMALMRIATIFLKQKNDDLKIVAYERLLSEYPNSSFVSDAMIEILISLYNEGRFKELILRSSEFINKCDSEAHLSRTYTILGDTYMSLDFPKDAVFFYHIAQQKAQSPEVEDILIKIKMAIYQLSAEDISSLLMRIDNEILKSYLLHQLGVHQFEKQNYPKASTLFSEFIEKFPNHERAKHTRDLIEDIHQRTDFKRHFIGCLLPLSGSFATFGRRALPQTSRRGTGCHGYRPRCNQRGCRPRITKKKNSDYYLDSKSQNHRNRRLCIQKFLNSRNASSRYCSICDRTAWCRTVCNTLS